MVRGGRSNISVSLSLFFFFIGLMVGESAWAQWQSHIIDAETPVYSRPVRGGEPAFHLSIGDEVRLSVQSKKGFRAVQYKLGGRIHKGYVLVEDVTENIKKKAKSQQLAQSTVFVSAVYSFQQQNERELQTTADSIYNVGKFTGSSYYFAFGYNAVLSQTFDLRAALVLRNVYLEGEASQEGSPTIYKFALEQNYYGVMLGLKYKPASWEKWSLLGELEVDKTYNQELKVKQGPTVDDSQMEDVTNFVINGVLLYAWPISKKITLEPALRVGSVVSAVPYILLFEAQLSLHF